MISNEEMALKIRDGDQDLILQLWERVRPFIAKMANEKLRSFPSQAADAEDLIQSGYLALVDAVRTFTPDMECTFTTWLAYCLKHAFSEALGLRSERQKRDPIHNCRSLDEPVFSDDPEGVTLADTIPDDRDYYEDADQKIWTEQLRLALDDALRDLPEDTREIIQARYYDDQSLTSMAKDGNCSITSIKQKELRAFRTIRQGPHRAQLVPFLLSDVDMEKLIDERTGWYYGLGLNRFKETQTSGIERMVIQREGMRRRMTGGGWHEDIV